MKKHIQNAVIFLLVVFIAAMTLLVSYLVYVCFFYVPENITPPLKELQYAEYTEYLPNPVNVRPLGRTVYSEEIRYISMSGAGVEFYCKGEYVTFDIHGYNERYQKQNHKARFAVYLNGVLVLDEIVDYDKMQYKLDISSYYNGVTVKIMKLSEAQYSSFGVGRIGLYSSYRIAPTAPKNLNIEFIGDSITCGYGVDEKSLYAPFSTATENFSQTYAYRTAVNLEADFSVVAFSGYGVYSGFTTGGRNAEDVIGKHYDKASVIPQSFWNFSDTENDIVVINLGTNDASYCANSISGRNAFTAEYNELIKNVRANNPNAYILCILGDMNNSLYPCIEEAVRQYSYETWDSYVSAETISFDMGNTDIVIDGHPGILANYKAANELTDIINQLIASGKVTLSK